MATLQAVVAQLPIHNYLMFNALPRMLHELLVVEKIHYFLEHPSSM
jgi:hypothetical protein